MPNFIRGLAAAGVEDLRAIATSFAAWQLCAPLDASLSDATALAADYFAKLKHPEHVFGALAASAQDRVAIAVGCPPRSAWKPAAPIAPGTPEYRMPSWEKDVYEQLFARAALPAAAPRQAGAKVDSASAWPEFSSLATWKKVRKRAAVAEALASALGNPWKVGEPSTPHKLPRVRASKLGLSFVVVPGGSFDMGLSVAEQKALAARAKRLGPEALEHVRDLVARSRPVRTVVVDPFLCAETPLLGKHAAKLSEAESMVEESDAANAHRVLRLQSGAAASVVNKTGLRLLAEAEWEWIARAGGTRAWLSDDDAPDEWTGQALKGRLEAMSHPFGVFGLGWGEWVDDGWHATYRGAPKRSRAWEPKTEPEVVRAGAFELWPWQVGSEALLLHATARGKAREFDANSVRLAQDLPGR